MNVWIQTLGCDKNTADSSSLGGLLRESGATLVSGPDEADLVVVNTCGFILPAKEESIGALLDAVALKADRPELKVVAVGCLVQKHLEELRREIPELDGFFGVHDPEGMMTLIETVGSGRRDDRMGPKRLDGGQAFPQDVRGVSAYLKIADGCDTRCTYCTIPDIKGPYVSRRPEVVLAEARALARAGVRELILVAQDTTRYGTDLPWQVDLADLLRELCTIEPLRWIRILYAYPDHLSDKLLETMAAEPKICHYLDIPFQHADDDVLRRMGRRQTRRDLLALVQRVRRAIPDGAIRSTMIVGFPGETGEAFDRLLSFLEEARLDWVGAFPYSCEEGTPAARYPDQVPDARKQKRYQQMMLTQKSITARGLMSRVGQTLEVLVEEEVEPGLWQGRSQQMAPDVDGVVWVQSEQPLAIGTFIPVAITHSLDYDLIGEAV